MTEIIKLELTREEAIELVDDLTITLDCDRRWLLDGTIEPDCVDAHREIMEIKRAVLAKVEKALGV